MAFDPFTAGFDLVKTALDKWLPDANEELRADIEKEAREAGQKMVALTGQLEINKTEATHASIFVAGWRPATGWVCAGGLGYQVILMPILNGVLLVFGVPAPFPAIDISLLQTLIGGMLGLGLARSYDKSQGTDTKLISNPKK